MSKKIKNVLLIGLLLILLGSTIFTIQKMRNHVPDAYDTQLKNRPQIGRPEDDLKGNQPEPNEQDFPKREEFKDPSNNENKEINIYYFLLIIETTSLIIVMSYLILSHLNALTLKETLPTKEKAIILVESAIIISLIFTWSASLWINNSHLEPLNDETTKTTKKEDIQKGLEISSSVIDLDDYDENITLTRKGTYTLHGKLNHTVLIDADGTVILNLDGVTIENELTAAIANVSTNELNITLLENSENILKDGGSSEYDACLYSVGPLTIEGKGTLKVYGNQEEGEGIATETNDITIESGEIYIESKDDGLNAGGDGGTITINGGVLFINASGDGIDSNKNLKINGGVIYTIGSPKGGDAGIDTDEGFEINGGNLIALGSDMLETPLTTSKQKTISFTLSTPIAKDALVTLKNSKDEVITSFIAQESFKTLIISNDKLSVDEYSLYTGGTNTGTLENYTYQSGTHKGGEKVTINKKDTFKTTGMITNIK